jgi:arsenite-transporting ATPase
LVPTVQKLLERNVLFVGGKGGVGKTTAAASLAITAADRGRRCLLVSTDPAHSLSDIFHRKIGPREKRLEDNLQALEIDPDAEADRYIATVKSSMKSLVHPEMFPVVDRQLDLARQAPGSQEAALLERVADLMTEAKNRYDLLVFDTAPTGHTMRLLSLPEVMEAWTEGMIKRQKKVGHLGKLLKKLGGGVAKNEDHPYVEGTEGPEDRRNARIREILTARRQKFHHAREILLDRAVTAFVLVLTPEKLPILESKKAHVLLRKHEIDLAAIVVNRVLPDDAEGDFLMTRRRQEKKYLQEIERAFSTVPRTTLPLLPHDVHGLDTLRDIGRLLTRSGRP